ncbi:MAG: hypothetical protein OJF47_000527 [Nitrospira sp.]|nr:MAG: hypothetical protein OJF47_000527 [Nitrospira sp.]
MSSTCVMKLFVAVLDEGFNGATASLPWNLQSGHGGAGARISLQWGHGITAVESTITEATIDRDKASFNGATASLPWNPPKLPAASRARTRLQWGHGITAVESWVRHS